MIWKEAVLTDVMYCTDFCLDGLRKTTKNLNEDSRFTGRNLNLGPLEHAAEMPTNPSRLCVSSYCFPYIFHGGLKHIIKSLKNSLRNCNFAKCGFQVFHEHCLFSGKCDSF